MSNLQDGMSLLQTAEGGLSGINAIVQRMRELAVQSANDTLTQSDRMALQLEFGEIRDEIDRIADTTQFNRKKLLNGSTGTTYAFSIINADDSTDIVNVVNVNAKVPSFRTPDEFVEFLNSEVTGSSTLHGTDYEAFYNATIDKFGIRSNHNFSIDDSLGGYQKLFGSFENQEVPESSGTVIYEPASAVTSPSTLSGGIRIRSLLNANGPQTVTGAMTEDLDIADGVTATITLDSATGGKNINVGAGANVIINLNGTSTLGKITLGANSRLTIYGTGTLNSLMDAGDSGSITINGGKVTATGGSMGAGIGSGSKATGENINISGGEIVASGGSNAAGIGNWHCRRRKRHGF